MANQELVQKISNIVRNQVNPTQALLNLKKTQNIVPSIVQIIQRAPSGPEAKALVSAAPSSDIVNSISKLIANGTVLPKNLSGPLVTRAVKNAPEDTVISILKGGLGKNAALSAADAISSNFISKLVTKKTQLTKNISNTMAQRIVKNQSAENIMAVMRGALGKDVALAASKLKKENINERIREIKYEYSPSKRARLIGDLLRSLPKNSERRKSVSGLAINDIRNARNKMTLSNFVSNLGKVNNSNIKKVILEQMRRVSRPASGGRPINSNMNNLRRIHSRIEGGAPPSSYGVPRLPNNSGALRRLPNNSGALRRLPNNSGALRRLPNNSGALQRLPNSGNHTKALETIAMVPGGVPEVAIAAEALNETNGNVKQAIEIKGASPAAVEAVQKLGGPENALKHIRTRKLNKVLDSIKKQKLISIIAHNITKTNNIHPDDEKRKTYYKKIIKSYILKRPFADIVKKAARKKRHVKA